MTETENAKKNYGDRYNSQHEGYAVLLEEVEEAAERAVIKRQKAEEENGADDAEAHPLVKDKRFLKLSFFPDVIPECFKECEK